MLKYFLYITFSLLLSCSSSNDNNKSEREVEKVYKKDPELNNEYEDNAEGDNETEEELFVDGTYSAEVEYYNPNTGRTSYYTLDVEVIDNIVTVIHFSNGGWLDETHIISGGELDENGTTTIESDKGYYYTVTISR